MANLANLLFPNGVVNNQNQGLIINPETPSFFDRVGNAAKEAFEFLKRYGSALTVGLGVGMLTVGGSDTLMITGLALLILSIPLGIYNYFYNVFQSRQERINLIKDRLIPAITNMISRLNNDYYYQLGDENIFWTLVTADLSSLQLMCQNAGIRSLDDSIETFRRTMRSAGKDAVSRFYSEAKQRSEMYLSELLRIQRQSYFYRS